MRKTQRLRFVILIAFVAMAIVSCSLRWLGNTSWQPPAPVGLTGGEKWSTHHYFFFTFESPEPGKPVVLPLRDGEFFGTDDLGLPYRKSDGAFLALSLEEGKAFLNGKCVSLNLDKTEAWQWLETATPEQMRDLRVIHVTSPVPEMRLPLIAKVANCNPHVGLTIEGSDALERILPLFDPVLLSLEGGIGPEAQEPAFLKEKPSTRTLFLGEKKSSSIQPFIQHFRKIETLILLSWNPKETGPLPGHMEHLKRLILLDPRLEDLGAIGIQPTLEELSLIGCERHVDLAALPNLPGLEVLNFQCFDRNLDLKPLTSLEDLKWLGLPPTTTQEQLENIVRDHPNLIGLELFQTDSIVDLTSIRELQKLKYLVVGNQHAELDPLFTMKGLRWLAIASKDKEVPRKLQIALPGTAVVLVRPVCLGSGWILLLAPGVLLARCVKKRRRKPAQKGDGV